MWLDDLLFTTGKYLLYVKNITAAKVFNVGDIVLVNGPWSEKIITAITNKSIVHDSGYRNCFGDKDRQWEIADANKLHPIPVR